MKSTSLQIKDGFLHELLYRYEISVTDDHGYAPFVGCHYPVFFSSFKTYHRTFFYKSNTTRTVYTSGVPEFASGFFCGIRIVQSSIFCVCLSFVVRYNVLLLNYDYSLHNSLLIAVMCLRVNVNTSMFIYIRFDRHIQDIIGILLEMTLNTNNPNPSIQIVFVKYIYVVLDQFICT